MNPIVEKRALPCSAAGLRHRSGHGTDHAYSLHLWDAFPHRSRTFSHKIRAKQSGFPKPTQQSAARTPSSHGGVKCTGMEEAEPEIIFTAIGVIVVYMAKFTKVSHPKYLSWPPKQSLCQRRKGAWGYLKQLLGWWIPQHFFSTHVGGQSVH